MSGVVTANSEALKLYRQVLRCTRKFVHPNQDGVPWKIVLRRSARSEFEQGRYETDPVLIARMLIVGKDCIMQVQEQMENKLHQLANTPKPQKARSPYGWEE